MTSKTEQSPELTKLGFALLALIAAESRVVHAYEVVGILADRGGAFGYSESQIYRELKRLAVDGYLEQREAVMRTNDRRVTAYSRTEAGMRAMRIWASSPVTSWPKVDISEVIPRLRAARVLPAQVVLDGLRPLKDLLEDEIEELRIVERQMKRDKKWDLLMGTQFDLQQDLLAAHLRGLDRGISRLEQMASDQAAHAASETCDDDSKDEDYEAALMDAWVARTRPTDSGFSVSSEDPEVAASTRRRRKRSPGDCR